MKHVLIWQFCLVAQRQFVIPQARRIISLPLANGTSIVAVFYALESSIFSPRVFLFLPETAVSTYLTYGVYIRKGLTIHRTHIGTKSAESYSKLGVVGKARSHQRSGTPGSIRGCRKNSPLSTLSKMQGVSPTHRGGSICIVKAR